MSEPKSIAEEIREGLRNLERGLGLIADRLDKMAARMESDKDELGRAPKA